MDLTVERATFLPELTLLQGVIERKSTIPILSHVLLDARDGKVHLTATDLDVTIRSQAPATVAVAGSVTIPAKKLFELVRSLPDAPIRMRLGENNSLLVDCARSSFRLIALSAADYPTLPTIERGATASASFSNFRNAVARVIFATSQEEGRFQISGGLLKLRDSSADIISTDGHRLALVEFQLAKAPSKKLPPAILIPKKALAELNRFDAPEDTEIVFGSAENHLFFQVGNRELLCRSLDLKFPDYEKVISRENDRKVQLGAAELAGALKRVALFAADRSRAIRVACADGEIALSCANPDLGEAKESIAVSYNGPSFFIGLNAQYLIDFLSEAGTENVHLAFRDENTHCLASPATPIPGILRYLYIVMPMKI
jgi:DNA polymerase-3 subunit beta